MEESKKASTKAHEEEMLWRSLSSVVVRSRPSGEVICSSCGRVDKYREDGDILYNKDEEEQLGLNNNLRQLGITALRKAHLKGHIEGWIK